MGLSLALESIGILLNYLQTGESSLVVPSADWLARGGNFFGFASSTIASVVAGSGPVSLTALGVTVLMLTPYARVVAAVSYYAIEKDWRYLGITLFVFAVITLGLVAL